MDTDNDVGRQPGVKCLVWDLDNTLWQGTLLEDRETRLSEAVRKVVVELDSRGIVQSVASKNDYEPAWARLDKLGMAEYFVAPRIGWGWKSASVREIADQLNFAYNTIAFIDDQAAERAEVAFHLPDVRCYAAEQVLSLVNRPEFSPAVVTADARCRRQQYQAGFRRETERAEFPGPDQEFLLSLDPVMHISRATPENLYRVEELTVRTSQMNATGVHYSDITLRRLLADPTHEVLVAALTDRIGPHGAVGIILLRKYQPVWHLKLLATSCRVVLFGAGSAILNWLINQASRAGVHLVADFRATERNRMMEIAYRFAGFSDRPCQCLSAVCAGTDLDGIQRLHLVPMEQGASSIIQIIAPDLGR